MEELHCALAGTGCSVSVSLCLISTDPRNSSHKGAVSQLGIGSFSISCLIMLKCVGSLDYN